MKTSQSARQLFTSIVKGKNFMTPNTLGYYKIKRGAVELTTGKGFRGSIMYGVTVVKNDKHNHDLSEVFYSKDEALNYINSLNM